MTLKLYKKQPVPAWQQRLVAITGALFGATLLLFAVWAVILFLDWARVDDCMAENGSYRAEAGECGQEQNHSRP